MTGYPDQPDDLPEGSPYWKVAGRNGYWGVDEREVGVTGSPRTVAILSRWSEATEVCAALNAAYRRGRREMSREIKKNVPHHSWPWED